jgi:hypothetical protein
MNDADASSGLTAAARIDEQLLLTGLDQNAGAETVGTRRWYAGPEERHPEVRGTGHCGILMPVSLTTVHF